EPDLAKLQKSIEKGTSAKADLEYLLAALLSERSSKEHVEFLKNLIKELEKAIRDQKVAISKNQSSAVDKDDAKKAQEVAQNQVEKILKQIKDYEAKTTGKNEDKKGDGEKKPGEKKPGQKSDPKDSKPGDGKPNDGKPGEG